MKACAQCCKKKLFWPRTHLVLLALCPQPHPLKPTITAENYRENLVECEEQSS
jgi:hypothetical protein